MATTIELSTSEIHNLCQRYFRADVTTSTQQDVNNFQVLTYKLKPTSDAPAGFLGRHLFLNIDVLIKDTTTGKEHVERLRFFTKTAPVDIGSRMEYIEEFGVFKKEILAYSQVLPQLQQIYAQFAPKCYYADNNMLIFENLSDQGYKMAAGRDGLLNYEHLNCALKALAAMHASSLVYEVRQGKQMIDMYAEALIENAYPTDVSSDQHVRVQNFNQANLVLQEIIKLLPKYQANLDFILEEAPRKMRRIFELAHTSTKYRNVFSHGDLWANNIMFQYGKFGETPIQTRFVDFQLARYTPPMLDVMTILTIPTSRKFRQQYLKELLANYYRFLSEFLKREQLSIDDFIPEQQFHNSAEEFRICGIIESILFSHLTILPSESTQHLTGTEQGFTEFFGRKRIEICLKAFHTDQMYQERLTDMVEDLVDNYVLSNKPKCELK